MRRILDRSVNSFLFAYRNSSLFVQRKATALFSIHLIVLPLALVYLGSTVAVIGLTQDSFIVLTLVVGIAANAEVLRRGRFSISVVGMILVMFVILSALAYLSENHEPIKLYMLGLMHVICLLIAGLAGNKVFYSVGVGVASVAVMTHYFLYRVLPAGLKPFELSIDSYIAATVLVVAATLAAAFLNHQIYQLIAQYDRLNESLDDLVTERTRQLEKSQQRLIESERLASLGGVVAGLSHEINTPLGAAITAQSHLDAATREVRGAFQGSRLTQRQLDSFLEKAVELGNETTRSLRTVTDLVERLRTIVDERDSSKPTLTDIRNDIDDVLTTFRERLNARPGIHVRVYGPTGLRVPIRARVVWNVLVNTIDNALRFAFPNETGIISVRYEFSDTAVTLVVADNGIGMDEPKRKQVFDPFFTTSRGDGHTGLGMNIVYNSVISAGGTIDLQSTPGTGTSYTITLPVGG